MIRPVKAEVAQVIDVHSAAGRRFEAGGVRSFVREQGAGPTVVLLHGVPASSFLYRKVVGAARRPGRSRAWRFDFPGLGLADRPAAFDYSWSGLARWLGEALDALGIDRCHLVVHDIGGPIGCEWAIRNPERVLTHDRAQHAARPRRASGGRGRCARSRSRGVGELWLRATPRPLFAALFRAQGLADRRAMSTAEIYAYTSCSRGSTAGAPSCGSCAASSSPRHKQRFLWQGLAERSWPARIVWGERRPGARHRAAADRPAGARGRRSRAAPGQALPAGGPGAAARLRDRRPRGAARLGANPGARRARSRRASARRAAASGLRSPAAARRAGRSPDQPARRLRAVSNRARGPRCRARR